jgi:hypothetical protein
MADVVKQITVKDLVYAAGGLITLIAHYYMLKMEIHDAVTTMSSEIRVINYRLDNLEARNNPKTSMLKSINYEATLPKSINIEDENNRESERGN